MGEIIIQFTNVYAIKSTTSYPKIKSVFALFHVQILCRQPVF